MKKRAASLLLILCMLVSLIPAGAVAAEESALPFSDVNAGDWFYDSVVYIFNQDLMNGVSDTLFNPRGDLSRAMFVTILGRLDGFNPSKYTENPFTDVANGQWHTPYICWAAENEIVGGYDNGLFGTNDPITREQMAAIIARYISFKNITLPEISDVVTSFNDASSVSEYAVEGLELMRISGIIRGDDAGNFNPKSTATRAEAAMIFMRLSEAINGLTSEDIEDGKTPLSETPSGSSGKGSDGGGYVPPTEPSPNPDEPENPTPTPPDNLTDDEIDLGDITELIAGGNVEVIFGDGSNVRMIDGMFTNKQVKNAAEAAIVLNLAASLFGSDFNASASEITVQRIDDGETPAENFYRYSPTVNGIPVLGGQIILVTNDDGMVQSLFSTYNNQINNVDTYPTITEQEAIDIAIAELLSDSDVADFLSEVASVNGIDLDDAISAFLSSMDFNTNLVIFAADESIFPALTFSVTVKNMSESDPEAIEDDGFGSDDVIDIDSDDDSPVTSVLPVMPVFSYTYYVGANGANAGIVIDYVTNIKGWSTVYISADDLLNNRRTFTAQEENNQYRLRDAARNIETYKTTYGGFLWTSPQLPGEIVKFTNSLSKSAVMAHANISAVYDYYKNILGRNSFDGYGAKIKVTYDYDANAWFFGKYGNAFWTGQQIVFGNGYDPVLDVMAHEFTHAVIDYAIETQVGYDYFRGLIYSKQSGGLNESYADILGSLIEGKTGSGRWTHREDSSRGVGRSFSNPTAYGQIDNFAAYNDSLDVHTSSGIYNFAAYKMMTDSRTSSISTATWARVFYRSLFRLSSNATFLDGRGAVISSAKALGFNASQQQAIKDAFDAVGIVERDSIRIVLRWGSTPSDLDSHLVGPGVNNDRFHIYFGQRNYYAGGSHDSSSRLYAADLDYDDTTSYGPEVTTIRKLTPGDYYFYVHDFSNGSSATSTEMATSGATVNVYRGSSSTPLGSFSISAASNGTYWNVVKITIDISGIVSLTPIDTYGTAPSLQ